HQIAWHEISMHQHTRLLQDMLDQGAEYRIEQLAQIGIDSPLLMPLQVPLGKQLEFAPQQWRIVLRKIRWTGDTLLRDQCIDRGIEQSIGIIDAQHIEVGLATEIA